MEPSLLLSEIQSSYPQYLSLLSENTDRYVLCVPPNPIL